MAGKNSTKLKDTTLKRGKNNKQQNNNFNF
jgi:hypothetical protein